MATTWRELIDDARRKHGDGPLIACTLSEEALNEGFDESCGLEEGRPFTAWTDARVYFPICYDGSEWCGSAPRNPSNEALKHQGGG